MKGNVTIMNSKKLTIIVFLFLFGIHTLAKNDSLDKIQHLDWNGFEVVWIEDDRFPVFDIQIAFQDGSLSDPKDRGGLTRWMFGLLMSGTSKYTQKEIVEDIDHFGAKIYSKMEHEYSLYAYSGLIKDLKPLTEKICHLFKEASYPTEEIEKEKERNFSFFKSLPDNLSALTAIITQKIMYKGTPFAASIMGNMKSIQGIDQKLLREHLSYFNTKVVKKFYLRGSRKILELKNILQDSCPWNGRKATFVRSLLDLKKSKQPLLHLITVPKSNQAQIVMGTILDTKESKRILVEDITLTSKFLGGGFSSLLMDEVRQKQGLTYGINSSAKKKKQHTISLIRTFTKSESLGKTIDLIQKILRYQKINKKKFENSRKNLIGSHPFQFENIKIFLNQLMLLDHLKLPYSDIFDFNKKVKTVTSRTVLNTIQNIYNVDRMTLIVIGEAHLANQLKKYGDLKITSYEKFL